MRAGIQRSIASPGAIPAQDHPQARTAIASRRWTHHVAAWAAATVGSVAICLRNEGRFRLVQASAVEQEL